MLKRSFKAAKCKTSLRLALSRMKLVRNSRETKLKQMKRELAQLLQSRQETTARIRVEHVIREQNLLTAYEFIELFCELIVSRLPIIESQKSCPIDLKEAIATVIFSAPRCSDLPELQEVRSLFGIKYGKEFISAAAELRNDCGVNRSVIEKLSARAPNGEVKLKILKDIAKEHQVEWDPSDSEKELLKKPEDLLDGTSRFTSSEKMMSTNQNKPLQHHNAQYVKDESSSASYSPNPSSYTGSPQSSSVKPLQKPTQTEKQNVKLSNADHNSEKTQPLGSSTATHGQSSAGKQNESNLPKEFDKTLGPSGIKAQYETGYGEEKETEKTTESYSNAYKEWNMNFKDSASAAQAAAFAAEKASIAARAAAKLSDVNRLQKTDSSMFNCTPNNMVVKDKDNTKKYHDHLSDQYSHSNKMDIDGNKYRSDQVDDYSSLEAHGTLRRNQLRDGEQANESSNKQSKTTDNPLENDDWDFSRTKKTFAPKIKEEGNTPSKNEEGDYMSRNDTGISQGNNEGLNQSSQSPSSSDEPSNLTLKNVMHESRKTEAVGRPVSQKPLFDSSGDEASDIEEDAKFSNRSPRYNVMHHTGNASPQHASSRASMNISSSLSSKAKSFDEAPKMSVLPSFDSSDDENVERFDSSRYSDQAYQREGDRRESFSKSSVPHKFNKIPSSNFAYDSTLNEYESEISSYPTEDRKVNNIFKSAAGAKQGFNSAYVDEYSPQRQQRRKPEMESQIGETTSGRQSGWRSPMESQAYHGYENSDFTSESEEDVGTRGNSRMRASSKISGHTHNVRSKKGLQKQNADKAVLEETSSVAGYDYRKAYTDDTKGRNRSREKDMVSSPLPLRNDEFNMLATSQSSENFQGMATKNEDLTDDIDIPASNCEDNSRAYMSSVRNPSNRVSFRSTRIRSDHGSLQKQSADRVILEESGPVARNESQKPYKEDTNGSSRSREQSMARSPLSKRQNRFNLLVSSQSHNSDLTASDDEYSGTDMSSIKSPSNRIGSHGYNIRSDHDRIQEKTSTFINDNTEGHNDHFMKKRRPSDRKYFASAFSSREDDLQLDAQFDDSSTVPYENEDEAKLWNSRNNVRSSTNKVSLPTKAQKSDSSLALPKRQIPFVSSPNYSRDDASDRNSDSSEDEAKLWNSRNNVGSSTNKVSLPTKAEKSDSSLALPKRQIPFVSSPNYSRDDASDTNSDSSEDNSYQTSHTTVKCSTEKLPEGKRDSISNWPASQQKSQSSYVVDDYKNQAYQSKENSESEIKENSISRHNQNHRPNLSSFGALSPPLHFPEKTEKFTKLEVIPSRESVGQNNQRNLESQSSQVSSSEVVSPPKTLQKQATPPRDSPTKLSSHVHPKLPDYDDLAAKLGALRTKKR